MLCRIVLPGSIDSFLMKSPTCLNVCVCGIGAAACLLLMECVLFSRYSGQILTTLLPSASLHAGMYLNVCHITLHICSV